MLGEDYDNTFSDAVTVIGSILYLLPYGIFCSEEKH